RTPDAHEPRREWRAPTGDPRPLLITGGTGTLGQALAHACEARGIPYRLTRRQDMALDDGAAIARCLDAIHAWGVINAAGWVRVDDAEAEREACFAANAAGAVRLAEACSARGLAYVTFSSDLVFDGRTNTPYVESAAPAPLCVYGASKAQAEAGVLAASEQALVVRTAAFFSPYDSYNFAAHVARTLQAGHSLEAADDLVISPTYVPDLVEATLDLMIDGETGIRHLANEGAVSWAEFARLIAEALSLDAQRVRPVHAASFGWPAQRPPFAALGTERGQVLPPLEDALARYAARFRDLGLLQPASADAVGAERGR
ncbi:MAG TPA: NAD(P)-dependent oxidoreductase, partial [Phenylobacterium sp.]